MVECNDKKCPKHGNISVRGSLFTGVVVSAKPGKTAIIERTIVRYVPKYERYNKSKSRIYAHNPDCISAKEQDVVRIGETRKLSKTKSFVVLEVLGKEKRVEIEEDTFVDKKRKKKEEENTEAKAEEKETQEAEAGEEKEPKKEKSQEEKPKAKDEKKE